MSANTNTNRCRGWLALVGQQEAREVMWLHLLLRMQRLLATDKNSYSECSV